MGSLRKKLAGQRWQPDVHVYNAMVAAAQFAEQQRGKGESALPDRLPTAATILMRNNSGATVPWYGILALTGQSPAITVTAGSEDLGDFKQQICLNGIAPVGGGELFAVIQEPLAAGTLGTAIVAGMTLCQINVTNAGHGFAQTAAGDTAKLVSTAAAATGTVPIVWKESGTGTKWAYVLLPPAQSGAATGTFSGAMGYNSGAQNISDATPTDLTFDSEYWDTDSYHSTGSNTERFVVPTTGYYDVSLLVYWSTNLGLGNRLAVLQGSAGSPASFSDTHAGAAAVESTNMMTGQFSLTAGDYVKGTVTQTSGGLLTATAKMWISRRP